MKRIFLRLALIFFPVFFFAQSSDFVTELLSAKEATFGHACYISAVYQHIIDEDASQTAALNRIFEQGILPANADTDLPIPFHYLAKIFCRMWNADGGLLYRVTRGNSRYAFRQLKRDGIIDETIDPHSTPTGREVLNIFTLGEIKYKGGDAK